MNRILIGLFILIACKELPEAIRQTNTWIGGEISNALRGQIELLDAFDHQVAIVDLNEGKNFSFDVSLESGGYFRLKQGEALIPIYLSPGYRLSIQFDANNLEKTLRFAGRGQESNQYMKAYESFEQATKPPYELLLAKSEAEFLVEARRYRSKSEAFLNKYQSQHFNLDPNFIAKERARILYAWANRLIRYPEAHVYYTGEDEFAVSDTYRDYKKTVNLDAIDLISLPEYQVFVTSYIDSEADLLMKKGDKRDHNLIRFDLANQLISEQDVKDYALYQVAKESLLHGMNDKNESLFRNFAKICQNGQMRAEIKSLITRWSDLSKGEKAPDISGLDRHANIINLADQRDKFIYLNFGASWCQPCSSDYQSLVTLSNQIDLNEIVLIAISIDEDDVLWNNMMKQRSKSNIIDIRIPADQLLKAKEAYLLNSLPVNVLIDPDGRIIDARAPAPSDPALLRLLATYAVAMNERG